MNSEIEKIVNEIKEKISQGETFFSITSLNEHLYSTYNKEIEVELKLLNISGHIGYEEWDDGVLEYNFSVKSRKSFGLTRDRAEKISLNTEKEYLKRYS